MLPRNLISLGMIASTLVLTACNKQETTGANTAAAATEETEVSTTIEPGTDTLVLMSSEKLVVTATVAAIDLEARTVTLIPEGEVEGEVEGETPESVTITVGEDAHNLDQVNAGDTITAEYIQTLTVDIVEVEEGTEPAATEIIAAARAEKGETPAGGIAEAQIVVMIVEEINTEDNTFKLKAPDGEIREYTAQNPENLQLAKVGDAVVITMTESVAIALTGKAGEAGEESSAAE